MTLKVVNPIEVTDAVLIASDIPEPDLSQGEESWQDEAARIVVGNFVLPSGYGRLHHIMQNDFGEYYLLVQAFPGTAYKIAKYDADYNFIYDYGDFADIVNVDPLAEPEGISNNGNTVYVFWKVAGNNYYEQLITNIGQEGGVPLAYTTSTGQLANIPVEVKSANRTFFTVSSGNKFVLFSDNQSGDDYEEVRLYRINQSGSLVSSVSTGISAGNAQYLSSNKDGGVIATVSTDYSTEQTDFIEYDIDLTPTKLGSVKFSKYSSVPARITSYFEGAITWAINSKLSAVTNAEFTALSRTITNAGAYKAGDEVIRETNHRKYRCLVSETFSDPADNSDESSTAEWVDIGPTNRWAMFDDKTTTPTVSTSDFSVTLSASEFVDSIGLFGISNVDSITTVIKDSLGAEIYNQNRSLIDVTTVYDHYTYYLYQLIYVSDEFIDGLPVSYNPEITLTFHGSNMKVGAAPFGFSKVIGTVHAEGTKTDSINYSRQEYDEFGELTYIQRPSVNLNTYAVFSDMSTNPYIQKLIKTLSGKSAMWVGDIGMGQKMITYGVFERSPVPYQYPEHIKYEITVRGSI